ncbi:MAG TPA: glycosyl hydrolase [Thermomicrobiales bacterium]|nr:glycosyl hydrolase [Thermomicrobiales bacterium]
MADIRTLVEGLHWRQAGPFRGGRSVAVAGHTSQPLTYYFGACSGGVWKTEDGGASWLNVSDGYFRTASVGAVAVAESAPNVVYAGMGEACIRGNVTHGDGVYRSDDAGESWRHLGLESTLHIARVRVHPHNADLVYVAAFGHAFGPHEDRGVYRSADGGATWDKVLYRDERTGACDLSMDATNPRTLYAAMWEAQRSPWSLVSGGPGSGIFKTTDGGDTWVELTDNPGLPKGLKGRIGITVSPARPQRIWAIVESKEGGLFRSDNGGDTWTRVNDNPDLRQRPWYYMHIFADPVDPDTVYVLNLGMWKSVDAGSSFTEIPTPHGDNHDLWIDPANTKRMVEANDGGGCVSFDGGVTWSSIYNQPTAQLYHVITDTQFPYRIYGAQQDNTTITIPSYSDRGAITEDDTWPVGGGESGYIAVRPDNPDIVYAGSYATRMTRYDHGSRQQVDITVWPEDPIGYGAESMKYRFQWTFPIVLSPHDPDVLYVTGNHVFRSTNGGQEFVPISPDLTRGDPETLGPSGGPITKDNVSTEFYGTIFAFAESPAQQGVLWAGSDDGRINVSRDGGGSWTDVTPSELPDWSLISIIDASPHDPATAWVAATRYKLDDFRPYLLRTTDYGATWQMIVNGIPDDDFTRVIHEDPLVKGLLYVGSETGLHVSWDAGSSWHRLSGGSSSNGRRALPVVPIHDLIVHGDDLIIGTHGRSFWVLDDLAPIRDWQQRRAGEPATLFPIQTAYRIQAPPSWGLPNTVGYKGYLTTGGSQAMGIVRAAEDGGTRFELLDAGENPAIGASIYYDLPGDKPAETLALSFWTAGGELIRRFSLADDQSKQPAEMRLRAEPGLHRFVWNMRHPDATRIEGAALSLYWGGSTIGPVVAPGTYVARLEVGDKEYRQAFAVERDPRVDATDEDLVAQCQLLLQIRDKLGAVHDAVLASRRLREQITAWSARLDNAGNENLVSALGQASERLLVTEGELVESRSKGAADSFNFPPKVNSKLASLQGTVAYGDSRPPQQTYDVYEFLAAQADANLTVLAKVVDEVTGDLNLRIAEAGIPALG